MTLKEYVEQAQRDYILAVLAETQQCVTAAARFAGVERTRLHRLISILHIEVIRPPGWRYGNKGNAEWLELGGAREREWRRMMDERLSATLESRAGSLSQKCQHD